MMNIETNNVTVTLEPLDVSKIKIDGRPPISKQKSIKSKVNENGCENTPYSQQMTSQSGGDSSKTAEGVSCKPLDSVENLSNGRPQLERTEEPKLLKEESSETRHLKDFILLHLDLIQQQQDLLIMKDRQMSQLKQDNNTLRCRLERMERRMSILKGGTPNKMETLPQSPASIQTESPQKAIKRRNSLEPQSLAKRFAKIARSEYEKDSLHGKIRGRHSTPGGRFEKHKAARGRRKGFNRLSLGQRRSFDSNKLKSSNSKKRSATESTPTSAIVKAESSTSHHHHTDSDPESHWISRTLRNRNLTSSGVIIPTPQKSQLIVKDEEEAASPYSGSKHHTPTAGKRTGSKHKLRGGGGDEGEGGEGEARTPRDNSGSRRSYYNSSSGVISSSARRRRVQFPKDSHIMKTGLMYYVPDLDTHDPEKDTISPRKETEDHVLVPSFRIKKFTPYYVIEGTENYDDEVFGKRHQKYELEEKKRKRWDLQRQREQEQLLKLQQKQNGRPGSEGEDEVPDSLIPETDSIEFIEVSNELPVSVFGVPIPRLDHRDFEVPWFDRDRRERQEGRKLKSRRR